MADYVAQVREQVGMDVPLSADHFGHIGVNSCIRLGKALTKYNLAWLEDMIPWQYTDLLKKITDAVDIPILTGEDIYLKEPFIELCRDARGGYHPSGPGDFRRHSGDQEDRRRARRSYGVPMAMHFAGTPVSCMANVHCAAATENFLVLENHSVDVPWWSDLVEGVEKPIVNKGFITVPGQAGPGRHAERGRGEAAPAGAGLFRADAAVEYRPDRTTGCGAKKQNYERIDSASLAAGAVLAPGAPRSRTRRSSR